MTVLVTESKAAKVRKTVDIDKLAKVHELLTQAEKDIAEMCVFRDGLRAQIQELMGDAEEARINGVKVYTWSRSSDYAWTQFRNDSPDIYNEFVREQMVKVLDTQALLEKHPGLLAPYRKRTFRRA